jgi:hypothetical protein
MIKKALDLIENGDLEQIAKGKGMIKVINEVNLVLSISRNEITDAECIDLIYNLLNK